MIINVLRLIHSEYINVNVTYKMICCISIGATLIEYYFGIIIKITKLELCYRSKNENIFIFQIGLS